ncbi:hypothetical protein HGRIS_009997 [Hohenbuehelia grisea]|uniref:Pentatricopeptide repeat-containing protein n=1 Tax=Hohenbuehelia grisea TaxID=104357 RepID=A0ABR3J2Z7_9AGAR
MLRTALCPNELLLSSCLSLSSRRASYSAALRNKGKAPALPSDAPRVPRYIRRQHLAEASNARELPEKKYSRASSAQRSGRTTQPRDEDSQQRRLLEPHVLSQRLKKLCDAGKVDEAVTMLKSMPLDAQNPQVWNTLIWECMKAKRYSLSYQLYTDMKRRGFSPTTRTYQTMFSGLSRIDHWSAHTKQLANAHALYDYFNRHIASVKQHNPDSEELSNIPLTYYIRILGETGHYQTIFDVYYALPSEGRMAPDQYIYTAMFNALAGKRVVESTSSEITFDAKHLWAQAIKGSKRTPGFPLDAHLVTAAIGALARGRAPDQAQAFSIAREYFGLTKPDGGRAPVGALALTAPGLAACLSLCNLADQPRLALYFLRQVRTRPERLGGAEIIDRGHIEEVLKAHVVLADGGSAGEALDAFRTVEWMISEAVVRRVPRIRPTASTYHLVLAACWRTGDWETASRTFELMTAMHMRDFADGAVPPTVDGAGPRPAEKQKERRATWRDLKPDPETMASMLRTAYATKNRAHMRQALRLADHIGADTLFGKPVVTTKAELPSSKALKHLAFSQTKLAQAVIQTVAYVESQGKTKINDTQRWKSLHDMAQKQLKASPPPEEDEEPLILPASTPTKTKPSGGLGVLKAVVRARSARSQHA